MLEVVVRILPGGREPGTVIGTILIENDLKHPDRPAAGSYEAVITRVNEQGHPRSQVVRIAHHIRRMGWVPLLQAVCEKWRDV